MTQKPKWLMPVVITVVLSLCAAALAGAIGWLHSDTQSVAAGLSKHEAKPGHAVIIERNTLQHTEIKRQLLDLKADVKSVSDDVKILLRRSP